jgi:hypothetical protein
VACRLSAAMYFISSSNLDPQAGGQLHDSLWRPCSMKTPAYLQVAAHPSAPGKRPHCSPSMDATPVPRWTWMALALNFAFRSSGHLQSLIADQMHAPGDVRRGSGRRPRPHFHRRSPPRPGGGKNCRHSRRSRRPPCPAGDFSPFAPRRMPLGAGGEDQGAGIDHAAVFHLDVKSGCPPLRSAGHPGP